MMTVHLRRWLAPLIAATLLLAGVPAVRATAAPAGGLTASADTQSACANVPAGRVRCLAQYRTPSAHSANLPEIIRTLGPGQIASAYRLSGGARGVRVGIVDAYSNPHLEADLAVYRKMWGLPPCTRKNGCLQIVNQRGRTAPLPDPDPDWGLETALDVDAVSAACPACRILVVQADSDDLDAIGAAVNTAVRLKAAVVSNSYGGQEFYGVNTMAARYYRHPGVPMVVSSGDDGFGPAQFPASSSTAIAVGGTSLTPATTTTRGWRETAWDGGGSGCSAWFAKPAAQAGTGSHCLMRTSTDVSALADPDSGFGVYDTFGTPNNWLIVGGTSLAAPLVAGMIARAGHASSYGASPTRLYHHRSAFNDITSGSNGYCGGDYLCTAKKGYDAPTGIGSPRGLGGL